MSALLSENAPPTTHPADGSAEIERLTHDLGRRFWQRLGRHVPSVWERRWWDDRIMGLAMADERVKVQMFRFVDVLPTLKTDAAVMRHLQEYLGEAGEALPAPARWLLEHTPADSWIGRTVGTQARRNALQMARRFIAGTTVDDVHATVARLRTRGLAFTLDLLGEAIISEDEADRYLEAYVNLIAGLTPRVAAWAPSGILDRDDAGSIPRMNVSVKLSALYSQFNPIDPAGTLAGVGPRLRTLFRAARQAGAYVHVDMEHYGFKDLTLAIFQQVLAEPEFRDWPAVGIVVQAYLPEAGRDLEQLLAWVKKRGTPVTVRLVKGAYWDSETISARARGWPVPVYQQKWESDDNFERQTLFLMKHARWLRPALASHNLRSLAHALASAQVFGVPENGFEVQMLYGMGNELARLFADEGYRVRIYTPFGELIPGMAYLVRRLLENTSNNSFLRASFAPDARVEDLLMKPAAIAPPAADPVRSRSTAEPQFQNEPPSDFSRPEVRAAMHTALSRVRAALGRDSVLRIGGRSLESGRWIESRNPSHESELVGRAACATPEQAQAAIAAARLAFPDWARTRADERAALLQRVAAEMRARRFELSAWMVLECGKPWAEADAETAEAIDFCEYYAAGMRQLARPRRHDVPGEENEYRYRPRGVAAVIAPWNFPLAILTGMTAAAVVAGNTVVMKPAEQSPIIAARLMELFEAAGLPPGVINYLPGVGEEIGPALVQSDDIDLICFTGSRTVGLLINREAAITSPGQRSVRRVIAEMGGKNAIVVDDDANLDEAVLGVLQSAFGYAGQKCSACSRAIVLDGAYDEFVTRLTAAARSLAVGPAEDPGSAVGPVIDRDAQRRIEEYIALGRQEARVAFAGDVHDLTPRGSYVAPHVFVDVSPAARIAQEEIFGPVLAVLRARDFEHALELANATDYALTGGVYSRSPAHLQAARERFEVGNLYLNRGITGAMVERHPFGGFRMSGIGSKAGGPDYLLQFLVPVNITENTMRRGFAPPEQHP